MWSRVAADADAWLNRNQRMTPQLWNAIRSTVAVSTASKQLYSNVTPDEYAEYMDTMSTWLAYLFKLLYGPCTNHKLDESGKRRCQDKDKTMTQVLLKYSSMYLWNSYRFLFMYQAQQHGIRLSDDMHPVRYIYTSRLNNSGIMKLFTQARKQGQDPWANIADLAIASTIPQLQVSDASSYDELHRAMVYGN